MPDERWYPADAMDAYLVSSTRRTPFPPSVVGRLAGRDDIILPRMDAEFFANLLDPDDPLDPDDETYRQAARVLRAAVVGEARNA